MGSHLALEKARLAHLAFQLHLACFQDHLLLRLSRIHLWPDGVVDHSSLQQVLRFIHLNREAARLVQLVGPIGVIGGDNNPDLVSADLCCHLSKGE